MDYSFAAEIRGKYLTEMPEERINAGRLKPLFGFSWGYDESADHSLTLCPLTQLKCEQLRADLRACGEEWRSYFEKASL